MVQEVYDGGATSTRGCPEAARESDNRRLGLDKIQKIHGHAHSVLPDTGGIAVVEERQGRGTDCLVVERHPTRLLPVVPRLLAYARNYDPRLICGRYPPLFSFFFYGKYINTGLETQK